MMIQKWAKLRRGDTTKLRWTRAMSVGNKVIDDEHEMIIRLVNEVEQAIRARDSGNLTKVFDHLEDMVIRHFKNEAKFAKAIGHPFEEHQVEHQYVLGEFQTMRAELIDLGGKWSESAAEFYYSFLSEWATAHIGVDDMKMKSRLENYPYDFIPPHTHD